MTSIAKKESPVLVALVAFISGVVDARLAELQVDHAEYTSDARPKGISRRVFNKECRSGEVAGAVKDGRTWRCSRNAWNAARATKPKLASVHPIRQTDLDDDALEALGHVGLRPTTRGSR